MSSVEVDFYLVVGHAGAASSGNTYGKASVRVSKSKPRLEAHEVAVAMSMALPVSLFRKPQLKAHIEVPADQAPFTITPVITENIARVVKEQTGITLHISAPEPEQSTEKTE